MYEVRVSFPSQERLHDVYDAVQTHVRALGDAKLSRLDAFSTVGRHLAAAIDHAGEAPIPTILVFESKQSYDYCVELLKSSTHGTLEWFGYRLASSSEPSTEPTDTQVVNLRSRHPGMIGV